MYKVGITHARAFKFFDESYRQTFNDAGIEFRYIDPKHHAPDPELRTLITAELSADEMDGYPNLEALMVPFAATSQLDTDALTRKNVRIFNTSAHAPFVAERALALILAVLGKIVFYHKGLERGDWAGREKGGGGTGIQWTTLFDKKVAIYGYGHIGRSCRQLLKPFRAPVGTLNYKGRTADDTQGFDSLEAMSEWCDVFIVAAPLNETTRGSIDTAVFKALPGKVLVNVGRGTIVDEDALYQSLRAGPQHGLKGLGSDVWYNYPSEDIATIKPSNHQIETFNHVIMSPHNAGTEESAGIIKYKDIAAQLIQISKGNFSRAVI